MATTFQEAHPELTANAAEAHRRLAQARVELDRAIDQAREAWDAGRTGEFNTRKRELIAAKYREVAWQEAAREAERQLAHG